MNPRLLAPFFCFLKTVLFSPDSDSGREVVVFCSVLEELSGSLIWPLSTLYLFLIFGSRCPAEPLRLSTDWFGSAWSLEWSFSDEVFLSWLSGESIWRKRSLILSRISWEYTDITRKSAVFSAMGKIMQIQRISKFANLKWIPMGAIRLYVLWCEDLNPHSNCSDGFGGGVDGSWTLTKPQWLNDLKCNKMTKN